MTLSTPPRSRPGVVEWVGEHFGELICDAPRASTAFVGGQEAADAALAGFDVSGYASHRNEVRPETARGASKLSPYIRHGLLQLERVWNHVSGGPTRDVSKYRFELLWQEYARHWYATHGAHTGRGTKYRQVSPATDPSAWPEAMRCVDVNLEELDTDGWLVNQARMWLSSQWAVRHNAEWRQGEDWFFRHLLDGSRAANRLGWQWTAGLSKQKVYGFSRRQVLKRAPGLCEGCRLRDDCPIVSWPARPAREKVDGGAIEESPLVGPADVEVVGDPDAVWITAESLGDDDPALRAHPDLPVVFIFDEPLLARLQLSSKRLVFLAETLADLACRRSVRLHLGRPVDVLSEYQIAVTFSPVPGFQRIARARPPAAVYPWPWLRRPDGGSVASFTQWNRRAG